MPTEVKTRFILCSECGAKNRLGEGEGNPKCGRCGKVLNVPRPSPAAKFILSPAGLWICGIGALLFLYAVYSDNKPSSRRYSDYSSYNTPPARVEEPPFTQPPVAIQPGVVHPPESEGVAPLAIRTRPGSNYYAKLVDVVTGQQVMSMYIIGGTPFETLVPLGQYELKYAAGDTWYGELYKFGPHTVYSKANTVFNFTREYDGYSGYTVELILQRNGNLRTQHIEAADF